MAAHQNEKEILKGLKRQALPHWVSPMLATLTEDYFSDPNWIYEEKFDGMRCVAIKKKGKVTLYSRNNRIINHTFPEIAAELENKESKDYVVDGEIVSFKEKVSSFSALQNRMNVLDVSRIKGKVPKVSYSLFDMMYWDQYDLRGLPLIFRKQLLKHFFPFTKNVCYTPHVKGKGLEFYRRAKQKGWEGIIAKRGDSFYLSKRSRDWLKFKCSLGQEFVIGGYTSPQGSRQDFGALLIGYYDTKGELHYAGKVGTGYSFETLNIIGNKLRRLETKKSPFKSTPKEKEAHWIRPQLVCEVEFTEWTNDGKLRHPRFKGLRKDKKADSVKREKPK
jgi:DNA ligase D-like protein (predicted ligase)